MNEPSPTRWWGGPISIGRSFLLWLLGVLLTVMVVVSALVLRHEQQVLEGELRQRAELVGRALAVAVAEEAASPILAVMPLADLRAGEVRAADGRVLWSWGAPLAEAMVLDPGAMRVVVDASTGPATPGRSETRLEVELVVSRARLNAHLASAAVRLVLGLGIALPLAMLLGLAVVGGIARPLAQLAEWVRDFHPGDTVAPRNLGRAPTEVVALADAFDDMARRLRTQRAALAASESRYRGLFSASPSALLELDEQMTVIAANPAAEPLLGLDPGRAVGRPLDDWVVAADVAGVRQCLDQARAAGEATVEAGWRMADGSRAAVELHLRALAEPSGGGVLVAVWDVTDRVRRAGERWRRTFDAMVDGVAVVSSSGRIELANLALENHLEAVQRDLLLRPGAGGAQDWQLRSRGRLLQCALSAPADLDHRVLVVRDITDATEAEGRLREAEKMEAVATLASGVAHDFNNLLAAILLQVRWLEREPEAVSEATAAVRGLAEEGSEVVHELLLFARREGTPARPLDVAAAVRDQEPVLRHLVTDAVALEIDTPPTPVPVVGSPVALRRMVLNLVLNARDAVANAGGAVTVRVGADDGRALIEVIDDGPGIPAEHRERIFEPFYSLRRYGRGAGLGLAVVHRVVTDHGGRLTVESPTGGGTRVAVYLPMCRPEELDADEPHGSDDRALVVGPGREAAEVMEWLADLGVESRHASSADELAELLADWRPTVIVAAGDSQPEVPGCGGLPVIHAGNPAAVAAALASAARARLATDGVDGRLR